MPKFRGCSGYCWACAINTERAGVECMAGPDDDYYVPFNPTKEAKRLADRGDFDPPANRDECVRCEGRNGGVPGNENMIDGEPVCDYCTAQEAKRLDYNQKVAETVARLEERRGAHVLVVRRNLTASLHIVAPGVYDTYKTFVLPLIRDAFPEAYATSEWFTPEPWASDPYMKVTISLDPKEQSMKTVYQACDGTIFDNQSAAVGYENGLFDDWLDAVIDGRTQTKLCDVVCHFKDTHHLTREAHEHFGTPWDLLKEALRTYWDSL